MISNRVRRFGSMTAVSGETPGQRRRDRHLIVNITIRTTTTVGRTLYFGAVNGNRGVVVWWLRERPEGVLPSFQYAASHCKYRGGFA